MLAIDAAEQAEIEILQQGGDGSRIGGIHPLFPHQPSEGPVHRTRVEIEEAEPVRQGPGHSALAGPGGTIDGNDWSAGHQETVVDQAAGAAVHGGGQ